MRIIVIGGSASKVGKTTLACHLIAKAAEGGRVVGLKVSKHARRRRHEIATSTQTLQHVAFHDTDRFLAAGASAAILLEAGSDNFRDHLAAGIRRARRFRPEILIIESTTAGAELRVPHDSWFVAGTAPWKPAAERHFTRAAHIIRTHELNRLPFFAPAAAPAPQERTEILPLVAAAGIA